METTEATPRRAQPEVDLGDRTKYLGGSDSAAALGINPYCSRLKLWQEKKGLIPPKKQTPKMLYGNRLEPFIAQDYEERHGVKLTVPQGIAHSQYPFLKGHVDRLLDDETFIEIKHPERRAGWGERDTDAIPSYYRTQLAFYFGLLPKAKRCILVAHFGDHEETEYKIERNDDVVRKVIDGCARFWQDHVELDVAPEPSTLEELQAAHNLVLKSVHRADRELQNMLIELSQLRAFKNSNEKTERDLKTRILGMVGNAEVIADENGIEMARISSRSRKEHVVKASSYLQIDLLGDES